MKENEMINGMECDETEKMVDGINEDNKTIEPVGMCVQVWL